MSPSQGIVTPQVTIRDATAEDCPAMLALICELAAFEREPDAVTVDLRHFTESGFGASPVWWAYVAEAQGTDGKTIVGMALWYIRYSTWKGQRMYLEDLIVTREWRNRGIGKQLMEALIEDARTRRFSGIAWQVLSWNAPAIDFYRIYQASFDDGWTNVSIDLPPDSYKQGSDTP